MIYNNATPFNLDDLAYGIKEIRTSVEAPNMNALAERFVGSVPRQAVDYYWNMSETNNIVESVKIFVRILF